MFGGSPMVRTVEKHPIWLKVNATTADNIPTIDPVILSIPCNDSTNLKMLSTAKARRDVEFRAFEALNGAKALTIMSI